MKPDDADTAQPAWILHTRAYRETSLLVEAFCLHHGRVGFIARGIRGARAQPLRAALQPLQALLLTLRGRGELLQLASAETHALAVALRGRPLLSAFYVNELLLALLPRQQPQPALFWRYGQCINALADEPQLGWTLRCFERDLIAALGYAMQLDCDIGGNHIDPVASYRFDPERGAIAVRRDSPESLSGEALIALAGDELPSAPVQTELRELMRRVIRWRLSGRELRSRRILSELQRVTTAD
ncbi:MAG: DNA repair protein RecO [Pseudomarimonas sp.]